MDKLPGNPYLITRFDGTPADAAIASSNYAIAFEQRTANLIAYARHIDDTDYAVLETIAQRLGFQEATQ